MTTSLLATSIFRPRLVLLTVTAASLAASLAMAESASVDGVRMRRFALMAGFNDGGSARPVLRFATTDAKAMGKVLETLGGVSRDDLLLVEEPTREAFLVAFKRLNKLLAAGATPGVRIEVVVYYSGHSDEEGLLIGRDRVSYDELRVRIQAVPADMRFAILDSCASGAFTRHKGSIRRAPFLMDAGANTKGHAFLTSSAINEVAQELNRIGASFFTHYLVSGLRGAADVNRDRRVTLQEAFQFAAQETLAHTEKTRGGPQHAAYEFDLVGSSNLVVTDVRSTQASLALGNDLAGRIGVRDAAGNLMVELRKTGGKTIELGLEAGTYLVTMEGSSTNFEAEVALCFGQHLDLARLSFHPSRPLEVADARVDVKPGNLKSTASFAGQDSLPLLHSSSVHLGLVPMSGDIASQTEGMQLGVINLATHGLGFNVGVINVAAKHDGETLGILNLIGNGIHSVAVYATDSMLSNLELKLGSQHLYTSFQYGYQPGDALAPGPK